MATLVFFHAHPDDESIATGGSMARAAADGHRVVLVLGTRGECGEVADGFLADGESLGERREQETGVSAAALGAHRMKRALGLVDDGAEAIAKVFQLHPHFHPRTYVDLRVQLTGPDRLRVANQE